MRTNIEKLFAVMIVIFLLAACGQQPGNIAPPIPKTATATTSRDAGLPLVIATSRPRPTVRPTATASLQPTARPTATARLRPTAKPTLTAYTEPFTAAITAPVSKAIVQGSVQISASASKNVDHMEFYVDNHLRYDDQTAPYSFNWDAFHERFGTHPTGVHTLHVIAYDDSEVSAVSDDIPVWVVPAPAGDCNSDGRVDATDVISIDKEVNDGDGTNPEDSPNGTYIGNPACDANEDNQIDSVDSVCAQSIISRGEKACLDLNAALVVPLIFVPKDLVSSVDQNVIEFVRYKIEEARRFYARANNGRTFQALPLEVVYAENNHKRYWVDGTNYEYGVLEELQRKGYPINVNWVQVPSNRLTWVLALGSGGWAGGRHYPTGGGFSMWGDGLLFAALDLNCDRVVDGIAKQGIADICRNQWLPSGQIYGFGIGGAIHELGHGFNLPHPPDGDPAWETSVMGGHWNYPNWVAPANGLADADRTILGSSHFFPGFSDTTLPTAVISNPQDGSSVNGLITISVGASDNDGVAGITLTLDGVALSLPPWQFDNTQLFINIPWDTTGIASGRHTLELIVTDTAGNTNNSVVNVNVQR